jgi:hypothetical protein
MDYAEIPFGMECDEAVNQTMRWSNDTSWVL